MKEYHKIQSIFKRDERGNLILGEYSLPEFEFLRNNVWQFTEKVDGTNVRIMWDGKKVSIGGRTDNAQISTFLLDTLMQMFYGEENRKLFIEKFGEQEGTSVCLYGEGYGARILKGGGNYIPDGVSFVLFDVLIADTTSDKNSEGIYLKREDVEDIGNFFGVKVVPIIGYGTLEDAVKATEQGQKSQWGDFLSEGVVARPLVELKTRGGDRIITKIKHKDFNFKKKKEIYKHKVKVVCNCNLSTTDVTCQSK